MFQAMKGLWGRVEKEYEANKANKRWGAKLERLLAMNLVGQKKNLALHV